MEELETKRMVEQYRILTEDEWERSREKRVSNWRNFSQRKFVIGTRRSDGGIRPPPVNAETRPDHTPVDNKKKNL
jgi:DnaJ family protein C protein 8